MCFGDSLTAGYGVPVGKDYPSELAMHIDAPIINAGKSGDTSAQGLERFDKDVYPAEARIVIICFGGNDYLQKISKENTKKNISKIIKQCTDSGSMVILLHCKFGLFMSDPYLEIHRELAEEHNVLLIEDMLDGILGNPQRSSDPLHPNEEGYALMAERVAKVVKPLLDASNAESRK